MKKLIFIFVIILFSINIDIANAVQVKGTTGDIAVTLTTVSVTMDGEVDPSINKMNIILDVYDETSKKVVAGPTTVLGKLGETRTTGSVDISKLDGSRNYLLRGKEASTTSTGDKFEVPFNTLKKPAVGTSTPASATNTGKCDIDKAGFSPYGNTNDGFFKESNKPTISIVMQTINCAGQELKLTVKELDRCVGSAIPGQNCNDALTSSDLDNKAITIPSTGNLTLNYLAGEENCETLLVPDGYDCLYYFELVKPDGSKWSSMDRAGGAISYECDGVCDTDWELKSQKEDAVGVGSIDPRIAKDEYTLLAPIGEIKSIGEGRTLGDYINLIVTIFLGICGALAVIMIIIYGLQWMGTDSVFGKTEAKQNIGGALMGLVLALGSWMLLNTINPDLLGGGLSIGQARVALDPDIFIPKAGGGELGTPNVSNNITTWDTQLKTASSKTGVQCTLIKAFMYAESNGVNNLTSKAGAQGLIQLMPATFAEQKVGKDPMDPYQNTLAGAIYIKKLQSNGCNGKSKSSVCDISNIQDLAAAYNGGPKANGISKKCKGEKAWSCLANPGYAETRTYAPRVEANYKKLIENNWGC